MGRGSGFVKFVVAPVACGVLGFFVIGPFLGRNPKMKNMVEKATHLVPSTQSTTPQTPTPPEMPASEDSSKPTEAVQKPAGVSVEVHQVPDEPPRHRRRRSSD